MNLKKVYKIFPLEKSCIDFLERVVWNNVPTCPYCNSTNSVKLNTGYRYHCNNCNTSFSVTVNTVFHKTKIPLQKWFYIIYLKEIGRLDVPVRSFGKEIEVTKDTANRIINRVNNFYSNSRDLFTAIYSKISNYE